MAHGVESGFWYRLATHSARPPGLTKDGRRRVARVGRAVSGVRRWTRTAVHDVIDRAGVDAVRLSSIRHSTGRRARLLSALKIDMVIDVGANSGQFGAEIRRAGYEGEILSIEPMAAAYRALSERASRDPRWTATQCALGRADGQLVLHVAGNSASSSFLEMLPAHEAAAPGTAYVRDERVRVRRLEEVLAESLAPGSRPYLKVDVQGYELEVLAGGGGSLQRVIAIQLELSLARLYADAPLASEVDRFVTGLGYTLAGIEPGFTDPESGRLFQMDGIYVRPDDLARLPGGAG